MSFGMVAASASAVVAVVLAVFVVFNKSIKCVQRSIKALANSSIDDFVGAGVYDLLLLIIIGSIGDGGGVIWWFSIESAKEETDEFEKERGENKLDSSFTVSAALLLLL